MARVLSNTNSSRHSVERHEVVDLTLAHAEEVSQLEQECYNSPWSRQLIYAEFERDISLKVGLTVGGEVVAYSFSYILPPDMHLLNIAVSPSYRGRGFGRILLAELLLRALDEGVGRVSLEVRVGNNVAQSLYRKVGFRAVGTRKGYYRDNGEDALLLELLLKEPDRHFLEELAQGR